MNNTFKTLGSIAFLAATSVQAGDTLSADRAVALALQANYGILIARDNAAIAKRNNTPGNAGMLPSAAVTASDNYIKDGTLSSSNGSINSLNATAALSWTVFDGGKMFIAKSRLAEQESLGTLQLRDRVMATIYDVTAAFYDVVRQKQQLASTMKVLTYDEERVVIMQTSFAQGLVPKTALLQAQIDLNVDKGKVLLQRNAIVRAKRTLNQLLSRGSDTDFEAGDSIPLGFTPEKERLQAQLMTNNSTILLLEKQAALADLGLKEATAQLFPKVALSAGYVFSQNDNTAAAASMSRTTGPQVGGTVTIPVYQSGNATRQIQTAKIELQSARYALEAAKLDATTRLQKALDDFANQEILLKMEQDNATLAKENLEISMQRLRFGQATALELRQAEESYEQSLTRLIDIKYDLKMTETTIKQLVGDL